MARQVPGTGDHDIERVRLFGKANSDQTIQDPDRLQLPFRDQDRCGMEMGKQGNYRRSRVGT